MHRRAPEGCRVTDHRIAAQLDNGEAQARAKAKAKALVDGFDVELWELDRLIERFKGSNAPG